MTDVLTRPKASARLHLSYARGPVFYDPIRSINGAKVDWTFTGTATSIEAEYSGNYVLHLPTPPSGESSVSRLIRGLTPGRSYTLAATAMVSNPDVWGTGVGYVRAGVDGIGSRLWTRAELNAAAPTFPYIVDLYTFTATDTAHRVTFTLEHEPGATPFVNIDNVYLYREAFTSDVDIEATDAEITLDASRVMYGTGSALLKLDPATAAQIDPRIATRVEVTLSTALDGSDERSFDLGLRARRIDHAGRTISLELATDEAMLNDYAPLAPDRNPRTYEASVRALCNYVLGKIGASLAAGTVDANITAQWATTNLVVNPCARVATTGWQADVATGTATVIRGTTAVTPVPGVTSMFNVTAGAGVTSWVQARAAAIRANEGDSYTVSGYYFGSSANRTVASGVDWYDANGTRIGSTTSPSQVIGAAVWHRASVTVTAPRGAASMRPFVRVWNGLPSGQWFRVTGMLVTPGEDLVTYFDGATTATGAYTFGWTDTADDSTSERYIAWGVERSPDMFIWEAGVSAWDFLEPILAGQSMRLYCDEKRVWRLITNQHETTNTVTVTPDNMAADDDEITRDDTERYATGCVVNWSWTERGKPRTYRETFGLPHRVHVIDMNAPYPGQGLAEAIVNRRATQGRTQDIEAVPNLATEPFGLVNITPPTLPATVEQVESVTFTTTADTMRITTRTKPDV